MCFFQPILLINGVIHNHNQNHDTPFSVHHFNPLLIANIKMWQTLTSPISYFFSIPLPSTVSHPYTAVWGESLYTFSFALFFFLLSRSRFVVWFVRVLYIVSWEFSFIYVQIFVYKSCSFRGDGASQRNPCQQCLNPTWSFWQDNLWRLVKSVVFWKLIGAFIIRTWLKPIWLYVYFLSFILG